MCQCCVPVTCCSECIMISTIMIVNPFLQEYLEEDFFHLFPPSIQPWDAMLLWGTAFSRSSLHIDPYNWTGTNAVLNGRKRWKVEQLTWKSACYFVSFICFDAFYRCADVPSWPRSPLICKRESNVWVPPWLLQIQQVRQILDHVWVFRVLHNEWSMFLYLVWHMHSTLSQSVEVICMYL